MKVIGILPFKNEERFLPTYLSNVQPVCDEIIAIDDHSTDNSRQIMEDAGVIVKGYDDTEKLKGGWTCGLIRQHLLIMPEKQVVHTFFLMRIKLLLQTCSHCQRYNVSVGTR